MDFGNDVKQKLIKSDLFMVKKFDEFMNIWSTCNLSVFFGTKERRRPSMSSTFTEID